MSGMPEGGNISNFMWKVQNILMYTFNCSFQSCSVLNLACRFEMKQWMVKACCCGCSLTNRSIAIGAVFLVGLSNFL